MDVRWNIQKSESNLVKKLSKELGVNEIVAHLLVLRGITTYNEAKKFFRPQISDLHDPFLMKGMKEAVDRIQFYLKMTKKF